MLTMPAEVDIVKMESHLGASEPVRSDLSLVDHAAGTIIAKVADVFVEDVINWEMV